MSVFRYDFSVALNYYMKCAYIVNVRHANHIPCRTTYHWYQWADFFAKNLSVLIFILKNSNSLILPCLREIFLFRLQSLK